MRKYEITSGVIARPVKVVLYGPEGIGKSTFAAAFPDPVFIDTEGGTGRLDVARLPAPTSWAMLLDEVAEVSRGNVPCATLVIDTADWAERLCTDAVCARFKVKGIEDFGYGKGYTYLKEEFARLLDGLEEVIGAGRNVVVTAHAQIVRFEQPDAAGSYDRWTMKTSKQVAPLLREWCDMLLFANYKTTVEKSGSGPAAKNKASGGRRVLYTAHHPCWDAKNRFGLPEEVPFEFASIAPCLAPGAAVVKQFHNGETPPAPAQALRQNIATPPSPNKPAPVMVEDAPPPAETEAKYRENLDAALRAEGIEGSRGQDALRALMVANKVEAADIRKAVAQKGYFPADMPVKDYPEDFVQGCLVGAWDAVYKMVAEYGDVPF